jgi:hypothetical protein
MAPIFALVVQSLIEHVHNLVEICRASRNRQPGSGLCRKRTESYLLKVMAAISAISVPVGPQGSLLVAETGQYEQHR